jgi:hypothetical protein
MALPATLPGTLTFGVIAVFLVFNAWIFQVGSSEEFAFAVSVHDCLPFWLIPDGKLPFRVQSWFLVHFANAFFC